MTASRCFSLIQSVAEKIYLGDFDAVSSVG